MIGPAGFMASPKPAPEAERGWALGRHGRVAHHWRESLHSPDIARSTCGREELMSSLQDVESTTPLCQICSRALMRKRHRESHLSKEEQV